MGRRALSKKARRKFHVGDIVTWGNESENCKVLEVAPTGLFVTNSIRPGPGGSGLEWPLLGRGLLEPKELNRGVAANLHQLALCALGGFQSTSEVHQFLEGLCWTAPDSNGNTRSCGGDRWVL
jgi:hypothetical protein